MRLAAGRFWMGEGTIIDIVEEKALLRTKLKELRDKLTDEEVEKVAQAVNSFT